jgi:Phage tail lysozyme
MANDPWTVAQAFIDNLNDMAAKERYYSQTGYNNMYRSMIDRQDADWLNQQKILADETNYTQQLGRDEAARQFTHEENWLRSQYDNTGSKSRFAAPGGAAVMPPYHSPYDTTSSTGPGALPGGNGPDTSPEPELSPQGAYNYYLQQGVPAYVAAGIVSNLDAESSFSPDVWEGRRTGDNGTARYGGQYRGSRQTNLVNFARQRGHAQPTTRDQLDFYIYEGTSGLDKGAQRALQLAEQADSPEAAARIIMQNYERPSSDPRENQLAHRERFARQVFEQGGGAGGGGGQVTATPGQRRYPYPVEQPDDGTMPGSLAPETSGPTGIDDEEHVWTEEELNQYLTPDEVAAIKNKGMDVQGPPRIYTDTQLSQLPDEITRQLMPVYKKEQYGPSEWLYLTPRQGTVTEDGIDPGGEPQPQITTDPVEIKKQTTNPVDPKSTESVRVRNGVWETLIDGQWVRME